MRLPRAVLACWPFMSLAASAAFSSASSALDKGRWGRPPRCHTVRFRGMGTGISEASKRVPIFSFATQGGKQVSSHFRQRNWVQAREATHCQGHQDPSKSVPIFLRGTEALIKMVPIYRVPIPRCSTVMKVEQSRRRRYHKRNSVGGLQAPPGRAGRCQHATVIWCSGCLCRS